MEDKAKIWSVFVSLKLVNPTIVIKTFYRYQYLNLWIASCIFSIEIQSFFLWFIWNCKEYHERKVLNQLSSNVRLGAAVDFCFFPYQVVSRFKCPSGIVICKCVYLLEWMAYFGWVFCFYLIYQTSWMLHTAIYMIVLLSGRHRKGTRQHQERIETLIFFTGYCCGTKFIK